MTRWSPQATVLSLLLCLCACAPVSEREPLRIGVLVWPPYELAFLAEDSGYLDPAEIELVDYETPAEVTRAFRYGLIDAHFLTTQYVLSEHTLMPDARIVWVIDVSAGGDSLLARPEIGSIAQLAGRRLGVEAGPLGTYMLQRVLDFGDLGRGDVQLRSVDTPEQVDAYESGEVDAVITYEPYRSRILELGAVELFDSRDIPGEIVDVLLAPEALVDAREGLLRSFVLALEHARLDLRESPDRALHVMARREGLTAEQLRRSLAGTELISLEENRRLLAGAAPELAPLLERQLAVMRRMDGFGPPVDPLALIDDRLLAEPAP